MQNFLLLVALIISCVSSFRFHGSSLSRSVVTPVSFRNSNFDSRIKRVLYVTSETSESEVIPEVLKSEQVIEAVSETKQVEEWRDPIAVAAEGKSPLADIFPGGINGGNILGFFIYGYIGYLFLDSVRIMVMNYGVTPPPL